MKLFNVSINARNAVITLVITLDNCRMRFLPLLYPEFGMLVHNNLTPIISK